MKISDYPRLRLTTITAPSSASNRPRKDPESPWIIPTNRSSLSIYSTLTIDPIKYAIVPSYLGQPIRSIMLCEMSMASLQYLRSSRSYRTLTSRCEGQLKITKLSNAQHNSGIEHYGEFLNVFTLPFPKHSAVILSTPKPYTAVNEQQSFGPLFVSHRMILLALVKR